MRAGNGRHRRPRQAPALLITAGVTGAGLALPLLGAAGAQAADTDTWDQVAECESGGVWSANAGQGYYGGLQMTRENWQRYGGEVYAERPDLASRSQQIAVAERILAAEGPDAWPRCAVNSGLTVESTAPPEIDPGVPLPSLQDTEAESSAPEDEPEASAPPEASSDSTADPWAPDEGTGRHRGEPDPRDAAERSERTGPRPPSRGGAVARTADVAGVYQVRPGDSLSAIADDLDVPGGWPALHAANAGVVGDDPDLILPGQRLDLGAVAR